MAPSPPRVDAQLQWDYSSQSRVNWTHSGIDGNIHDLSLRVYFINDNIVKSLRQFYSSSSNSVPEWVVINMPLPNSAVPLANTLHTLSLPGQIDVVTVISEAGQVFMKRGAINADPSNREYLPQPDLDLSTHRLVDVKPCLDADDKLFITLLTDLMGSPPVYETNLYVLFPDDQSRSRYWEMEIDEPISNSGYVIKEFVPRAIFRNPDQVRLPLSPVTI